MHHSQGQDNSFRGSVRVAVLALALVLAPAGARAVDVAGITIPESAEVDGRTLALNGAGLRSRFFVTIYAGALYLPGGGITDAARAVDTPGPKRVSMHIIHDGLSAEKVTTAWMDGFRANTPGPELQAMMPRIERFNALWPELRPGDVATVDFPPGAGVRVAVNGSTRGSVPGDDLQRAVLRIWLGDDPADSDLKRGMLGGG